MKRKTKIIIGIIILLMFIISSLGLMGVTLKDKKKVKNG